MRQYKLQDGTVHDLDSFTGREKELIDLFEENYELLMDQKPESIDDKTEDQRWGFFEHYTARITEEYLRELCNDHDYVGPNGKDPDTRWYNQPLERIRRDFGRNLMIDCGMYSEDGPSQGYVSVNLDRLRSKPCTQTSKQE